MREAADHQLWKWIVGEAAAERIAGVPLSRIERLGEPDLIELTGVGRNGARAIHAVAELARRFAATPPPLGTLFSNGARVDRYFRRRLANEERELCYVLALDRQNRLLRESLVGAGGTGSVHVEPREVFTPVMRERAESAIVIHNHPSGDPEPSTADREVAIRLLRAGEILGVRILDFVIVASSGYVSFAGRGFLEGQERADRRLDHFE